jgi:sulfotransferase
MPKTFFFMAGLPRSGSNLLTAILNQHPEVHASPQTDLLQLMYVCDQTLRNSESYRLGHYQKEYEKLPISLIETFYGEVNKPYIIDKNRSWSTPYNIEIAAQINPNVKIIAPVRNILDILASFVRLLDSNRGNNLFDNEMIASQFTPMYYRDLNEARCDWLMMPNAQLERSILALSSALKPEHRNKFHFVHYEALVENPQQTMTDIYNFLEIDDYEHNFQNIKQINAVDTQQVFGLPEIHKVRPTMSKTKTNYESVLSEYTINKYRGTLDFLDRLP